MGKNVFPFNETAGKSAAKSTKHENFRKKL